MHCNPLRPRGFSLVELVFTLVLLSILAGLAVPALDGYIKRTQMRAILDQLTADLYYARMLAVRAGQGVEVRFTDQGECVTAYEIRVMEDPPRLAKAVVVDDAGALCLERNLDGDMKFDSRGLPRGTIGSFWIEHGARSDSVRVSMTGRVLRKQ